ncbi:MAG: GNAT family N-acetyltransferase [Candidatus Izemoplasmataceae bacterium]
MMHILQTEMKYLSIFSNMHPLTCGTIFQDLNQRDKYMHNFLMVHKQIINDDELKDYEKNHRNEGFVIYRFEDHTDKAYDFLNDYQRSTYGYYHQMIDKLTIPKAKAYDVTMMDPKHHNVFFDFMYQEDLEFGVSYATGNIKRQKEVLIKEHKRFFYLTVKDHEKIIGHINAFMDGSYAKIDEFYVLDAYQKQGYGTALMSKMIEHLREKQITEVYLVTNLADTAQKLYERYGFNLVGTYVQHQKNVLKHS